MEEGLEVRRKINTISSGPPFTLCVWGMLLAQYTFPISNILILSQIYGPKLFAVRAIFIIIGVKYRWNHSHFHQNGVERRDTHHAGSLVIKTQVRRHWQLSKSRTVTLPDTNFFCIQLLVLWTFDECLIQYTPITRIQWLQQSLTFR